MTTFARLQGDDTDITGALRGLLRRCLEEDRLQLLLVPQAMPGSGIVQQTLVRDPSRLQGIDFMAPILPVNSASLLARLTKGWEEGWIGAVMRPCEIRAFVELVKLNQGSFERLLLIGVDCLGTFDVQGFRRFQAHGGEGATFFRRMAFGSDFEDQGLSLRNCCRACEAFVPDGADLKVLLIGPGIEEGLFLEAGSERGREIVQALGLRESGDPPGRVEAVSQILAGRKAFRERLLSETKEGLLGIDNLFRELSLCINCHNCREVCPVCYCKQCVFDSSTFEHDPVRYLRWADRKGALKMPTDTLFFHLTRMAHMSTSCVGCGQCSAACPMGIPVAEIFTAVASRTQRLFDYVPGRDRQEKLPIATFREDEVFE